MLIDESFFIILSNSSIESSVSISTFDSAALVLISILLSSTLFISNSSVLIPRDKAISLFNSIDCEFSDNHMKMFTQFVHDNDFPCLQTIDISRMN